ncbi:hypothetical protein FE783_19325 [Paenibacillus mesophilus]|uniref:hypothetical protein n=1 Tax=Paenibacillus mesophilus TaxID=2582849 RepID=UPI00110EFE56|nr:hypothetical protein [Paenibacillus mesophilus]TMV48106.1 hypothetical protein FE783_19325 [Paenibacillus mesophilus]
MAVKKEAQSQPAKAELTGRPEYTREELLAGAETLFAVKPEVVTGALFGSAKETYSIEEMERLIRQFQQRKVQR